MSELDSTIASVVMLTVSGGIGLLYLSTAYFVYIVASVGKEMVVNNGKE